MVQNLLFFIDGTHHQCYYRLWVSRSATWVLLNPWPSYKNFSKDPEISLFVLHISCTLKISVRTPGPSYRSFFCIKNIVDLFWSSRQQLWGPSIGKSRSRPFFLLTLQILGWKWRPFAGAKEVFSKYNSDFNFAKERVNYFKRNYTLSTATLFTWEATFLRTVGQERIFCLKY